MAFVRPPDSTNRPSPFFAVLLEDRIGFSLLGGRKVWFSSPHDTQLRYAEILTDGMTLVWYLDDEPFGHVQWVFVHPRCIAGRISPGMNIHLSGRSNSQSRVEASNLVVQASLNDHLIVRSQESLDGLRFSMVWTEGSVQSAITQSSRLVSIDISAYYQRSRKSMERFGEFNFPEQLPEQERLPAIGRLRGYTYAVLNNGPDYLRRPLPQPYDQRDSRLDLLALAWIGLNPRIAAQFLQTQLRLQKKDGRIPALGQGADMIGTGKGTCPPLIIWTLKKMIQLGVIQHPENIFPQLVWYINWLESKGGSTTQDGRPLLIADVWNQAEDGSILPESEDCRSTLLALEIRAYLEMARELSKSNAPHVDEFTGQMEHFEKWAEEIAAPVSIEQAICLLLARGETAPPKYWKSLKPSPDWTINDLPGSVDDWLVPLMIAQIIASGLPHLNEWATWIRGLLVRLAQAMDPLLLPVSESKAQEEVVEPPSPHGQAPGEPKLKAGVIWVYEEEQTQARENGIPCSPWISSCLGATVFSDKSRKIVQLPPMPPLPTPPAVTPHGEPLARKSPGKRGSRRKRNRSRTVTRIIPLAMIATIVAAGIHLFLKNQAAEDDPTGIADRALQIAEVFQRPEEALDLLAKAPQDEPEIIAATAQIHITSTGRFEKAREILESHPDIPEDPAHAPKKLLDLYLLTLESTGDNTAADQIRQEIQGGAAEE